jgi:hypothetical protein
MVTKLAEAMLRIDGYECLRYLSDKSESVFKVLQALFEVLVGMTSGTLYSRNDFQNFGVHKGEVDDDAANL